MPDHEIGEISRPVRKGTHPRRGDIQQMKRIIGRISRTQVIGWSPVDHGDIQRLLAMQQQLDSKQRSAKTPADNDDFSQKDQIRFNFSSPASNFSTDCSTVSFSVSQTISGVKGAS